MIKIDPSYDVIMTYSPIIEITGHIFECFDYYLFLRDYCKVGILFFCGMSRQHLKTAFESKYKVPFSSVEPDLIKVDCVSPQSSAHIITFGSKTTVILADGNIQSLEYNRIMLATKKLYGFMCGQYDYSQVKMNKHITFLQDFRIYGKNSNFSCIDYVKKLPFKQYKKCEHVSQSLGMMYVTYVCRKVEPCVIERFFKKSGCSKALLIVPYKLPEYDTIKGVQQVTAPVEDLFSKFGTYIYTPVSRKFDCSPRLVTECFMYGKRVFKDLDYYDIGLETRYNDCINNLQSLNLKEGDDILKIIQQSKQM